MYDLNNFDSIRIGIASPEKIREWSRGEVLKPETINYRTQKPEIDGLFCEKIFGPTRDWECHCGKYKRIRYKGVICDKCGVEVTKSKVRRERMGHIELAAPIAHIWYFKGVSSRISLILDMPPKDVEAVIYFQAFVVLDPGDSKETGLSKKQVIRYEEYRDLVEKIGGKAFRANMGAEAIKELLMQVDLESEAEELKRVVKTAQGQKRIRTIKRLDIVEAFRKSSNKPEWMVLDVLPVIPPELRPMVQLDGGRFATSDLNDLYRRVVNRNNRLKRLMEIAAPDIMIRNEKRMLQEAVDALIDNGRHGRPVTGSGNRELKSLSSMLKGKQGRFRQNLLGKRVDYSGRSVIVVGPELKLYQCGLPKEMALELFKPFVFKKLVDLGICHNIKNAKRIVEKVIPQVWDILEDVIRDHPVLLNRAPTLHRLGIQAFEPVLVEGRAIKLHPLVCTAFNADFDGDQMAVHVPLSVPAQVEARILMLASNNILKLSDGKPVVSPTQDMVIGSYYLTIDKEGAKGEGRYFMSSEEAKMAYTVGDIDLHAMINVRVKKTIDGMVYKKYVKSTVGRFIFNEAIPQDLGFVERKTPDQMMDLEIDFLVGKKQLSQIVEKCFLLKGATGVAVVLDKIKSLGFKFSTIGAVTASVFDMHIPACKKDVLDNAEKEVLEIEKKFKRGFMSDNERYLKVIKVWENATDTLKNELKKNFEETGKFNPIWMMANSGARGSMDQIKQLCGMRGLMSDPTGKTIEIPVKASFREGLTVLEYFISSHGGRKGLADTAIKTADSGYLTRRLVDVSHDVVIREQDCHDTKGIWVSAVPNLETLAERISGRYTLEAVMDPKTGEVLAEADSFITEPTARAIENAGVKSVRIRSVLTCKSKLGVCAKCYGKNMASNNPVKLGEAVGIIAAQSIGEPGTQLTMRTFHTGGVATGGDITRGLPRVVELFEARRPKGEAVISDSKGTITRIEEEKKREVIVTAPDGNQFSYSIPFGAKIEENIVTGAFIEAGDAITAGSINPQDILRTKGLRGVQEMLIKEVQFAYGNSGVKINDKHIEVIVRQMLKKVRIDEANDTDFLPGELVDVARYEEVNEKTLEEGGIPATAKRTLLGITKAALATESFLSAASFQETTRVLAEAAIKNKIDPLQGLKENVMIGKLIPAGTGMKEYKTITAIPNPNYKEPDKSDAE